MKHLMRAVWIALLVVALAGCGGNGNGPGGSGFTIASGNWTFPLGGPFAGGLLTQNGGTLTGILHVSGSSCFDPVADALVVQGKISSDANAANALTFTTAPVRGQVVTVSATWVHLNPGLPPTNTPPPQVADLTGTWAISGGACAASGNGAFYASNFNGSFTGDFFLTPGPGLGQLSAVLTQTGPDTQGFSQISGTFTFKNSSCFTSGTLAQTMFAGDIAQMTVVTDTGQLTGSAAMGLGLIAGANFGFVALSFTVHGGSCDGQNLQAKICIGTNGCPI